MAHPPPRYPIEIVRRLAPPAPARIGGRVVTVGDGAVFVRDVTGMVWVEIAEGVELPALGAWVLAGGTWNGQRIAEGSIEVVGTPRVGFPPPDGEWLRLSGDQGRRTEILRRRSEILRGIRDFFDQRAFIEVETPLVVPSPGLDLHLDALEVVGERDRRWLVTSPEYQMKRLLAGGLPRIYQLSRCFRRAEEGDLHQPEFTMLEWYRAFGGSEEIMRDTEQLVSSVAMLLHEGSTVIPGRGQPVDVAPPWERLTVREAFRRHAGVEADSLLDDEERFYRTWIEQVEPNLGLSHPVFVTRWPAQMASLARLVPDDPSVADRVEAFVGGVELSNGFGELTDPVEQRARLDRDQQARRAQGKPVYPVDERFLAALEEGLPPAGGNALGVDRLVMLVLGASDIRDVVAIPHDRL